MPQEHGVVTSDLERVQANYETPLVVMDEDLRVRQNAQAALLGRGPHGAVSRKRWLITYQTDFDGKLRMIEPYRLVLGDGLTRVGFTDRIGTGTDEQLPDGNCEVELLPATAPPR